MVRAALLALLALAACKIDPGNFDDRVCVTDVECRPDQGCRDGLCAQNVCETSIDCGPGHQFECQSGGCVAVSCDEQSDCGGMFECIAGFCSFGCAGEDADDDGICDVDDNCAAFPNTNQANGDGDSLGDACDLCGNDPDNDGDGDTICGNLDNCPFLSNTTQLDRDDDDLGNECDPDDDNDGVVDQLDPQVFNPDVCGDADADTCDDCAIGTDDFLPQSDKDPNNDGVDYEGDTLCDAGDPDDDNDGVVDAIDRCPRGDTGWTASSATDLDGDGCQNSLEDLDDDNDGASDATDPFPTNPNRCGDGDADTCDDCAVGSDDFGPLPDQLVANDGADADSDGSCNAGDADDDNDGVADGPDTADLNPFACQDVDNDTCDDCANAIDNFGPQPDFNQANDGPDTDLDGRCNPGDVDDDNDGVVDNNDIDDANPDVCGDSDGDTCDDCAIGSDNFGPLPDRSPANDGTDSDSDGGCDAGDADDDNDGVLDAQDTVATNPGLCGDADGDTCDDCAVGSDGIGPAPDRFPANDGADADSDGACNTGDGDDDNDGVADGGDVNPTNPDVCGDSDNDTCDDCAVGGDNFGPGLDRFPDSDGADSDVDGACDAGDADDDNDGVVDANDLDRTNPDVCGDSDADTCDDCAIGGDNFGPLNDRFPGNDGLDTDEDGRCDAGDTCNDVDGDGLGDGAAGNSGCVNTAVDSNDLDPQACGDVDADGCEDCSTGSFSLVNDGPDNDSDGACNPSDDDDDNDGRTDADDTAPFDPRVCGVDSDADSCDDCTVGRDGFGPQPDTVPANDGPDADGDGRCNVTDACTDVDGDGLGNGNLGNSGCVNPSTDTNDQNRFVCADTDGDTCNDCSSGTFAVANDGADADADAICNAGDGDDDNDGRLDAVDPAPLDPRVCGVDGDADGCDDCATGIDGFGPQPDFAPANDGTDVDSDGICTVRDCDDGAPNCTFDCTDGDGDGFCLPQDCDDCIPTCTNDCTTNSDSTGETPVVVNCRETFCGSDPDDVLSVCRVVTSELELNTAITAANTAVGPDFMLLNASFAIAGNVTDVGSALTIRQCVGTTVSVNNVNNATNRTPFVFAGTGNLVDGVRVANIKEGDVMFELSGNDNTIRNSTIVGYERAGIVVAGDNNVVANNVIRGGTNAPADGAAAIVIANNRSNTLIVSNVIVQNAHDGIQNTNADGTTIDHNTIAFNGGDGIHFIVGAVTDTCIRNNIIANNTGDALESNVAVGFSTTCDDPLTGGRFGNDQFGNGDGACGGTVCGTCQCTGIAEANLFEHTVNPAFASTTFGDEAFFCIAEATLIDSMDVVNASYDLNGAGPGNFDPPAPDGGGRESGEPGCP